MHKVLFTSWIRFTLNFYKFLHYIGGTAVIVYFIYTCFFLWWCIIDCISLSIYAKMLYSKWPGMFERTYGLVSCWVSMLRIYQNVTCYNFNTVFLLFWPRQILLDDRKNGIFNSSSFYGNISSSLRATA